MLCCLYFTLKHFRIDNDLVSVYNSGFKGHLKDASLPFKVPLLGTHHGNSYPMSERCESETYTLRGAISKLQLLSFLIFDQHQRVLNSDTTRYMGGSVGQVSEFGSGHDLMVHQFEPHVGLCADNSQPAACFGFCVSLSFCPSSPTSSLSLLQK